MGFGIVRIDLERFPEQFERGRPSLWRIRIRMRKRAQVEVIRVEIVRPLASGPVDLRSPQARFNRTDDTGDNPVLKIEDILDRPVELYCPQMCAGFRFDKLRIDPNEIAGPADAAFKKISDIELTADLACVHTSSSIGE